MTSEIESLVPGMPDWYRATPPASSRRNDIAPSWTRGKGLANTGDRRSTVTRRASSISEVAVPDVGGRSAHHQQPAANDVSARRLRLHDDDVGADGERHLGNGEGVLQEAARDSVAADAHGRPTQHAAGDVDRGDADAIAGQRRRERQVQVVLHAHEHATLGHPILAVARDHADVGRLAVLAQRRHRGEVAVAPHRHGARCRARVLDRQPIEAGGVGHDALDRGRRRAGWHGAFVAIHRVQQRDRDRRETPTQAR